MRIDVRLFTTDAFPQKRGRLEQLIRRLPFGEGERERLLRMGNETALRQSLGARLALWRLAKKRGLAKQSLLVERTETGKPYFSDPRLPAFSISHSGALCVAVLCECAGASVGVDVQAVDDRRHTERIAERFFTPEEQRACVGDTEAFFRLWTQKEAEAKRSGTGLASVLSDIQAPPPADLRTLRIRYKKQRYYVCVAASEPIAKLRVSRGHGITIEE